jgi:hypothetical protein
MQNVGDRARRGGDGPGNHDSRRHVHPERGVDVASPELLALSDRHAETLIHEHLGDREDHASVGHDSNVTGEQQSGKDWKNGKIDHAPQRCVAQRPNLAADGFPSKVQRNPTLPS